MASANGPHENLTDRLAEQLVRSHFDGEEFMPRGCINAIVTRDAVSKKLRAGQADPRSPDDLAEFVLWRSKTIFAILVCCSLDNEQIRETMAHFKYIQFDDSKLPVTGHLDDIRSRIFSSTRNEYTKLWNIFRVKAFCEQYQWQFLAPVFRKWQSDIILHGSAILPFTWASQHGSSGIGTFGKVYEVTIHPAHHENFTHVRPSNIFSSIISRSLLRTLTCKVVVERPTLPSRN